MFYTGVFDMSCGFGGTEAILNAVDWARAVEWRKLERKVWKSTSTNKTAGTVKQLGPLTQVHHVRKKGLRLARPLAVWLIYFCSLTCVLCSCVCDCVWPVSSRKVLVRSMYGLTHHRQVAVAGAGHLVPANQPEHSLELIENFIFARQWNGYFPPAVSPNQHKGALDDMLATE